MRVLRSEWEHRAALTVQKVPVVFHTTTSEGTVKYMKYLTPYGYQFVAKQLNLMNKVKLTKVGKFLLVKVNWRAHRHLVLVVLGYP